LSKVRVAIIGVGNCASSLVQGVIKYKNAKENDKIPGIMHPLLGQYHIGDICVLTDELGGESDQFTLTKVAAFTRNLNSFNTFYTEGLPTNG